jgi:hypothetical protein
MSALFVKPPHVRLRVRLWFRLGVRLTVRLGVPPGFRWLACFCCTRPVFRAGSLCDISMSVCSVPANHRSSRAEGALVRRGWMALVSRSSMSRSSAVGYPLGDALVPMWLLWVSVACRVAAGRRLLLPRSRPADARPLHIAVGALALRGSVCGGGLV